MPLFCGISGEVRNNDLGRWQDIHNGRRRAFYGPIADDADAKSGTRILDLRSLLWSRSLLRMRRTCAAKFSLERLLRFLVALGQDVDRYQAAPGYSRHAAQLRVA